MGCLTGYFNSKARVYDIDRSQETDSGQPIETIPDTPTKTIRVFFEPYNLRNPLYELFNAGRVKTGDYFCLSATALTTDQVLAIELSGYENFQVTNVYPLKAGKKIIAYQLSLERWKH